MSQQEIIVTSGLELPGFEITKICGLVRGIVVRSPTIAQGLLGGLKTIIGGRVESYRAMCESARNDAYLEMIAHAQSLGAQAIIAVRYDSSDLSSRNSQVNEILCYGTAVTIAPINKFSA
jgi:uncharacterized protein YbjQ (UPF0145 family)